MKYENIFDTHAHYDDAAFDADRDILINEVLSSGVRLVVDPGCDFASCEKSLELSRTYPQFYTAVGIHPESAEYETEEGWDEKLINFTSYPKVVAIGEIGLDYHYDIPRDLQKTVFEKQLQIASDLGLPVIIHNREAHQDTLDLVRRYRPKGIVHCFSGSPEIAAEFVKFGMYIGFTGSVTFKNANKLLNAAAIVPDDRILLETDSPYLSPVPVRGKRNDSSHIEYIAEKLSEIRGCDTQYLIDIAMENGKRVYNIDF